MSSSVEAAMSAAKAKCKVKSKAGAGLGAAGHEPLLSISCGDATAHLDTARFGPGGRSICVLFQNRWMSLVQYESASGRGSSHNWKKSIRHKGRCLNYWIQRGLLQICDKHCQCVLCRIPYTRQSTPTSSTSPAPSTPSPPPTTTAQATATAAPTPTPTPTPPVRRPPLPPSASHLSLLKVKDARCSGGCGGEDSDSGISVSSYSKVVAAGALKVDLPKSVSTLLTPSSSSSSSSSSSPGSSASSSTSASSASQKETATLAAGGDAPGDDVVDDDPSYTRLVQEALLGLRGSSDACEGVSQMSILLYVLSRHAPKDRVDVVHRKVRAALQLLARMDLVEKRSVGGVADDDDSEDDEDERDDGEDARMPQQQEVVAKPKKVVSSKDAKAAAPKDHAKKKPPGGSGEKTNETKPVVFRKKRLSPQLSAVCGGLKRLSRQDAVRQVWAYIKRKKLQDPKQKTIIVCDDKMRAITKRKRIPQTEMIRCLSKHLSEPQKSLGKKAKKHISAKNIKKKE